jgi:hypothetical protein
VGAAIGELKGTAPHHKRLIIGDFSVRQRLRVGKPSLTPNLTNLYDLKISSLMKRSCVSPKKVGI